MIPLSFGSEGPKPVAPSWLAWRWGIGLALACWIMIGVGLDLAFGGDSSLPPAAKQDLICEAIGQPDGCDLRAHAGKHKTILITAGVAGASTVVTSQLGRLSVPWLVPAFASDDDMLDVAFVSKALQYHQLDATQTQAACYAMGLAPCLGIAYLDRPRAIFPSDNVPAGLRNGFTARVNVQFAQ